MSRCDHGGPYSARDWAEDKLLIVHLVAAGKYVDARDHAKLLVHVDPLQSAQRQYLNGMLLILEALAA